MFVLTVDIDKPAEVSDRAFARVHRQAGLEALRWFVRERLMLRFGSRAMAQQLHFLPRDEWYEDYKRERQPGTQGKPALFTGRSQRAARGAALRVSKQRLTVALRGLSMGFARRRAPTLPDMRAEIQRFTREEVNTMARLYAAEFANGLLREMNGGRRKEKVV